MSEATEFFRICPSCGRGFQILLVSKKLVDDKREVEEVRVGTMNANPGGYTMTHMALIVVQENIPVTVEVEEFQYSYRCKHCGHEWSETRTKVSR